jgi:hypothetical protein
MVHKNIAALGALSVLALGQRAARAEVPELADSASNVKLTFALAKKKGATVIETYAQNTSKETVMVDDDPYVKSATLTDTAGNVVALQPLNSSEMFTRAGPRRHWVSVQPGEKLLVGSTLLDGNVVLSGEIKVTVDLVEPALEKEVTGCIVVSKDQT